ncbi:YtxH domain-containing protein [Cohnella luojiensis]|uniref:YtxH domain-containing protein n=1 Tax=Cohnella luojiensis TaxID=652876 RepID=A0A4Y8M8T3_9BACL|nr:YtxH domain-containing protein [Cohnella luojiensis]TFE31555.1 YtxH domain-containing protein [Cohnella luojiensis]
MSEKKSVKSFLWGTLAGAVTGAVTALLFAPKSGRELRGDIADTAQKVGEKTADISRQAGSAVQSLTKRTSSLVVDAKEAAGRLVTDIRSRKNTDSSLSDEVAAAEESYTEDKSSAL